MREAKRGRGRPPKKSVTRADLAVEWRAIPVLCDIGIVSNILGKCNESVRKLMVEGSLPAVRIGGEWRMRKDVLMAHLGYQPWEIARYGYGITVDRRERLQDEFDAGRRMMSIVG